ncbi:hypothetical protein D3C83_159090 [compost metagenome]
MMLKGGLLGVPLMLVCLPFVPLAAVATAIGEALPANQRDGTGVEGFTYPNGAAPSDTAFYRQGSSSFYPNSYWGCYPPRCR